MPITPPYKPLSPAKAIKTFRRNTKEVSSPGITSTQRSSEKFKTRVPVGKNKPMSMTYGSSSRDKGATKVVSKKRA